MKLPPLIIVLSFICFCPLVANAQGQYEFLGNAQLVPDKFSPSHGILYNTRGFESPLEHNVKKMERKGAPEDAIEQVLEFPGQPGVPGQDPIGEWIDQAFDQTVGEFGACRGHLAARAALVSSQTIYVVIEPTGFTVPGLEGLYAGVYLPDRREIHALCIYYIWKGQYNGWLRHAKAILKWEVENYFAVEVGIQPEPRTANWPCDAPPTR